MTDGRTFPENARDMGVTHSEKCWRWHRRCAERRMEELHGRIQTACRSGERDMGKWLLREYRETGRALLELV